PGERGGVALGEHANLVAVHTDTVVRVRHDSAVGAMHRVVLEEMRQRARIGEVVHGDKVNFASPLFLRCTDDLAPDASKSIDTDPNRHVVHPVPELRCQIWSPMAGARPKVTMLMIRAPASKSAAAHSESVAPVVITSSTSTRCVPGSRARCDCGTANAPETLCRLSSGVNLVCVRVSRVRSTQCSHTGSLQCAPSARASSAL